MKLRKIEILGFKSFRTKTGIEIGDGVTAVVGPNGCGKSNIVDAIRWAMGSQSPRDLRGRSMEDIIFGGSENHRQMGFAEVSLSFENNPESSLLPLEWRDQAMVKVTRRLFRNGDSDYEINGMRARLRDVHDVFAGTGVSSRDAYSIIEQGRIGFVVAARPEERRVMIEEAAGITRYKNQRKLASRRLERTHDNLLRVGDVVREVSRQVASLERQAQRAIAAREMRQELRGLEMVVHAETLRERATAYQNALRDFRFLEEKSQAGQVELAALDARYEALRLQVQVLERVAAEAAEAAYEARARVELLEANVEHRQRERTLNQQRRDEAKARLEVDEASIQTLEEDLAQAIAAQEDEGADDDSLDYALEDAEARTAEWRQHATEASQFMQSARAELSDCERTLARTGTRVEALKDELRTLAARAAEGEALLQDSTARATALRAQVEDAASELEGTVEVLESTREKVAEDTAAEKDARDALAEDQLALDRASDQRRRAEAALTSMNGMLATGVGIADGARHVLQQVKQLELPGVHGPLVARLRVAQEHEATIASVFGERVDAILVDDAPTALRLLEIAKAAGKSLSVVTLTRPVEGTIAPWLEAVAPVPGWVGEIAAQTERFETLPDTVERAAVDARRFWTDGEGHFVFRSGAMAAEQLLKAQREKESLEEALVIAEEDEVRAMDRVDAQQRTLEGAQARRYESYERLQVLEDSTRRRRLALEELRGEAQHAERQQQRLRLEHEASVERTRNLEADIARTRSEANAAQELRDGLVDSVQRAQRRFAEAESERELAEERLTTLKVQKARRDAERQGAADRRMRVERELEAAKLRVKETTHVLQEALRVDEALQAASEGEQRELVRWKETRVERDVAAAKAKSAFDAENVQVREIEIQRADLRRLHGGVDRDRESAMLSVERARNEQQRAVEACAERFGMSPDALRRDVGDQPVTPELLEKRQQLQRRLDALGAVNPAAEQEYAAATERYAFLEEQKLDLETALEDLESAIAKMDETCKVLFAETFEQVNEGFQQMFPRLFRGGRARLELTDPSDLLSTGVEIVAQPPGKRLQNLSLLSGGEKALTAAALIFAIFELRPSPICILDEVDAPLDEANVGRFAEMVREISARSQFLVITHNTRTMEVADTLYGVTMQEPGVSKLVGVHLRGDSAEYELGAPV